MTNLDILTWNLIKGRCVTVKLRKNSIVIILLALIIIFAGCGGADNPDENEQVEMPTEIMEMESGLLRIMQQADLVPVVLAEQRRPYNRTAEQTNEDAGDEAAEEDSAEEDETVVSQVDELTFEETILREVLEKEGDAADATAEEELPESTEIIWNNIKETVAELHTHWNELEPLLVTENITQDVIDYFEEGLDNLTVFITERDYFGSMDAANQLTNPLAEFMIPFTENIVSLTHELKFHIRNIVLQAARDDYAGAQESLDYIKEQRPDLSKELDEAEFRELETALDNLQRVLNKQNLDLIILNAAIVMENMAQVIERTAE